jgi:hypothetical protein
MDIVMTVALLAVVLCHVVVLMDICKCFLD